MKSPMRPLSLSTLHVRLLLLLLLVGAALVLTSCLGAGGETLGSADEVPPTLTAAEASTDDGGGADVLAAAATKTGQSGSAKFDMTLSLALPGAPERVDVDLMGEFDLARQRGRFLIEYGTLIEALGPSSAQVSAFLPDRLIFDETAVYLRMPRLVEVAPAAKRWVKLDVQSLEAQPGLDLSGADQLGQANPTQLLSLLESLEGSIENLGPDEVRGLPATHYRVTINMSKLASTAPAEQQALLEGQLEKFAQLGLDAVPVDVWIDDEGRVVAMSSTIAIPDTGTGASTIAFSVELYDFGAPVEIKTPAPKRVSSIETLLGAIAPTIQG